MDRVKLVLTLLTAAIFAAACGQAVNTPVANKTGVITNQNAAPAATPAPVDAVAAARDLYATNCAICHRDTGKGGKVTVDGKSLDPSDLTSDKIKNWTDDKLATQISEGAPDDGMPAFKGKLTPEQIKTVIKHLRALQGG